MNEFGDFDTHSLPVYFSLAIGGVLSLIARNEAFERYPSARENLVRRAMLSNWLVLPGPVTIPRTSIRLYNPCESGFFFIIIV